jgi:hypothetical protein
MLSGRATGDDMHTDVESVQTDKQQQQKWCWDEEGLFNLDEIGRHERQQCAVAVSNVLRNLSFMPENEVTVAQHRRCLETLVQCMEDHETGNPFFQIFFGDMLGVSLFVPVTFFICLLLQCS